MSIGRLSTFIRRLRGDIAAGQPGGLSDAQLLDRWLVQRDQAAFEVLLWRHGPMILSVCRRVLNNDADVEDAFQAAFLLLVRKAAAIRRHESVAAWLYRTAYRVALRARQRSGKQSARETTGVESLGADAPEDVYWRDVRPILDDEINRLPEKYRVPFIRCHLEGCTNEEAAVEMGCPVGTIHSRLSWARERLRSRLTRRGVTLAGAGVTALLAKGAASAALPPALAKTTLQVAFAYAAHSATAGASAGAVALAKGVLRTMFFAKLKLGVAVVLALALCGGAGGLVFYHLAEAAASPPRATPLPLGAPLPAPPASAEPTPRTIRVPSEVDGKLLGIFTEIKVGEKVAEKDVIVVGQQKYRRLREGDQVAEGQLLARVNNTTALADLTIAEAKIEVARAELQTSIQTNKEAQNRYQRIAEANAKQPGTYSPGEEDGAKLTWERYKQEEVAKKANVTVTQAELSQAKTRLEMYEIRSPVRGVLKVIHVQKGEAVKKLETVVEILPLDEK
jgi:RNA polymerase sigma factor (sigma-70 family)